MSKPFAPVTADRRRRRVQPALELQLVDRGGTLTSREVEVLELVATGHSNKRIARVLTIGEETAKTHLKHIRAKLGARDRTHSVALALRRGLIQVADEAPAVQS